MEYLNESILADFGFSFSHYNKTFFSHYNYPKTKDEDINTL